MTTTILHNARLIDGTGADAISDAVVVIDEGTITYAGAASGAPRIDESAKPRKVDVGGNTVCPGFFDCHVHLSLPGTKGSPISAAMVPPSYRYFELIDRLKTTIGAGVTTVRDLMGVDVGVRDAVAHGLVPGPRLLVADKMISQTGGHADFHIPSGLDGTGLIGGLLVDSVDEARREVRQLLRSGVDVIKVASSGGVSSPSDDPDWLGARTEIVAALVEEAHNYGGRKVAAHAIGLAGIRAAIQGGVHSVEHGYALTDELRTEMVERGQFLVPTLIETLKPDTATPQAVAKSEKWHKLAHESIAASIEAGIKVAVGTDAGLVPDHGATLAELGCLVKFGGMTPMEAIVAGTRTSAELCDVADTLGTLEAGKVADVVVVKGDPLVDIDSLADHDNILLVIKEGKTASNRGDYGI
ncbi:amidohydrolase family protein [Gordonia sp. zg691]|uniref:Amidohydrolase family protein n=1 Tax=Gordonia jinghuaiqii TaxID=2758710 RepID=A0A7D7RR76_9ACTN|nr:amidohydrolase family protein [Gordonia jinghuaiqii]MBD0861623.1 amidohydrolase family protein [Gordonia jinghuaiqii]MCR5977504.1 amidohydrolase family protein [Gordonia jinghuaiqii]QMT02193.1 amidohydrolase family protein [Gordonia jinghuaiqii]